MGDFLLAITIRGVRSFESVIYHIHVSACVGAYVGESVGVTSERLILNTSDLY